MNNIWKNNVSRDTKLMIFLATVEPVLMYGSETWTLTVKQEMRLDGTYTRMLRHALNVAAGDHISNVVLYGKLPRLSEKIRTRRLKLAGH